MNKATSAALGLILLIFLSYSAAATWSIDPLSTPVDQNNISDMASTAQIVELKDNTGDPVNLSRLENDPAQLSFIYNKSGGDRASMKNLNQGYYFAEFDLNSTRGLKTEFELLDDSSDGFEVNETESYTVGNMTIDLLTDMSEKVDPDREFKFNIDVKNSTGGFEDQADVKAKITNISWSEEVDAQIIEDEEYEMFQTSFDLSYGSKYILQVTAENSSLSYPNPEGSESLVFETVPELDVEFEGIESEGCGQAYVDRVLGIGCERGASGKAYLNVTSSQADKVNMSLMLKEYDSEDWNVNKSYKMEKEDGRYETSFDVPVINTSKYEDKIQLRFNASNSDVEVTERENISYHDYDVEVKSNKNAQPPTYEVKFSVLKQFSKDPVESNRFSGFINVTNPNETSISTFNISEMDYSLLGIFSRDIDIPFEPMDGDYTLEINIQNKFGREGIVLPLSFEVENINQAFEIKPTDLDLEINRQKNYSEKINITNMGAETISWEAQDEISDFTTVNQNNSIELDKDEKEEVNITFNISDVRDYEGEIKFMDNASNYNRTMDIDIDSPVCDYRNGSLCAEGDLNFEVDQQGENESQDLTLHYLGPEEDRELYADSFEGNISSYMTVEPEQIDVDSENSTFELDVNFEPTTPGYYEGELLITSNDTENLPVNLTGDANLSGELTASLDASPNTLDIGTVGEGESSEEQLTVENDGEVDVDQITVDTGGLNINIPEFSLSPGEEKSLDLAIPNPQTTSIIFTGSSSEGDVSLTVNVDANVIEDYSERTDELRNRMNNLRPQTNDSQLESDLNEVSGMITQVETQWDRGDYQEAETTFENAKTTLDSVQQSIDTQQTGGEGDQQNGSDENEGELGLPIIPIVAVLFVLILVGGVVFYESYIPEEGDPLYGVLGQ